jgi:hypothetical protein
MLWRVCTIFWIDSGDRLAKRGVGCEEVGEVGVGEVGEVNGCQGSIDFNLLGLPRQTGAQKYRINEVSLIVDSETALIVTLNIEVYILFSLFGDGSRSPTSYHQKCKTNRRKNATRPPSVLV